MSFTTRFYNHVKDNHPKDILGLDEFLKLRQELSPKDPETINQDMDMSAEMDLTPPPGVDAPPPGVEALPPGVEGEPATALASNDAPAAPKAAVILNTVHQVILFICISIFRKNLKIVQTWRLVFPVPAGNLGYHFFVLSQSFTKYCHWKPAV